MQLYFMRHAEAEDSSPEGDAGRRLTEKGILRSRQAGQALQALDVRVSLVLTSPLRRAVETAEIVATALGAPLERATALAGMVTLSSLDDLLAEHDVPAAVMLVGHEPDFSAIVGELMGDASVEMKKGAVACLDCHALARGGGTLLWLVNGRQFALMAK